ncbi:MAG: hypothetical protein R3F33_11015 [Planctomycetota bacterium]
MLDFQNVDFPEQVRKVTVRDGKIHVVWEKLVPHTSDHLELMRRTINREKPTTITISICQEFAPNDLQMTFKATTDVQGELASARSAEEALSGLLQKLANTRG